MGKSSRLFFRRRFGLSASAGRKTLFRGQPTETCEGNFIEKTPALNKPARCDRRESRRSLSVLIVCQYFYPENFGVNAVAAELASRGNKVTVLTGMPNYPSGVFADGYGGWKLLRETYKDVSVIRVPIVARGRDSRIRLILNYLSYAVNASLLAPFVIGDTPDVILVYQLSPVMIAVPALAMKLISRAKILLWVQDIWPDSLIATGAVKNSMIISVVRKLVRLVYRSSSIIAVQSSQFLDFVRPLTREADNLVRYLPNTADDFYRPTNVPPEAPERELFRPGFNILFAGNFGAAQDFEMLLAAIALLRERKDIQWVFVGQGRRRSWFEEKIQGLDLGDTVQIIGPFPPEKMPVFFSIADALLITLRDEKVFSLTVPSKLQSYLACRRPVLAAVSGECADIITAAGAGLVTSPNDPEGLARSVLAMAQLPRDQLDAMAKSGFEYHQREFNRARIFDLLGNWLLEISKPPACS